MSDTDFRYYASEECTGQNGYPAIWHESLKHLVREQAGHRCVRCGHPYRNGQHGRGEWSPCDDRCTHDGPRRYLTAEGYSEPEPAVARALIYDHGQRVEARWRILTVHHLDGDKGNCRWWNLAALCQRCHLQIQGRVRMDRRWLGEHTPWFRPYVAGFYAWTRLGEDLSREQVEARVDELLALEDRQLVLGSDVL